MPGLLEIRQHVQNRLDHVRAAVVANQAGLGGVIHIGWTILVLPENARPRGIVRHVATGAPVFSHRRVVAHSGFESDLRRRGAMYRGRPVTERVIASVHCAGTCTVTCHAYWAVRVIAHEKISCPLVDILVMWVMTAAA